MSNKEIKFRVDDSQDAWLTTEAKKAGIPKSKILLQLINSAMSGNEKVNGISDRIVGVKAKEILLLNEDNIRLLQGQHKVLWYEGYLWFLGKTANNSQVTLDRWLEFPFELFNCMSPYDPKSAKNLVNTVGRWNELKALEYIDIVNNDGRSFFASGLQFFSYDDFETLRNKATEAIEQYKLSLEAPRAVVEVVNDEIAIEATNDALTPLNGAEFKARFKLNDTDNSYSDAVMAGRKEGYQDDRGDRWFVSGRGKNAIWTTSQAKVLSIV